MFKIPASTNCHTIKNPVLLMHGHLSCSDFAVLMGPQNGLAYNLVDECHPVYLGNARSNIYAQKHKTLSKNIIDFWNFSYYEIGYYDVAAMVQEILNNSNGTVETVDYVGHSQASAEILVLLAERPEFRNKIGSVVLLAPSVYMHHTENRMVQGIAQWSTLLPQDQLVGNWLQGNFLTQLIMEFLCGNGACSMLSETFLAGGNSVNKVIIC